MQLMNKWNMNWFMLCVATVLITGCGNGGFHTAGTSTSTSTGGTGTGGAGTGGAGTGSLTVVNNATAAIDAVYVPLTTDPTWGSIKNPSSPIGVGASWTLTGLASGTYDVRVYSTLTTSIYRAEQYGFPVTAGATQTVAFANADYTGSLEVTNSSATLPITALYVSATALGAGGNVLSSDIVPTGVRQIIYIPKGAVFVRAVRGGVNIDVSNVAIASYSFTPISF